MTCSATEYQYHVADEQLVIGFTHSGHCSAPTTIEPPFLGCPLGVVVAPEVVFFPPPHAVATIARIPTTPMARMSQRNRIIPPFSHALAGAATGAHHSVLG